MMAEMFGLPWEGPVPKNMDFEPLALPPDPSQGDIQDQLQEMKAITIGNEDFQIFKMWYVSYIIMNPHKISIKLRISSNLTLKIHEK